MNPCCGLQTVTNVQRYVYEPAELNVTVTLYHVVKGILPDGRIPGLFAELSTVKEPVPAMSKLCASVRCRFESVLVAFLARM